jgi:hypothetical protein
MAFVFPQGYLTASYMWILATDDSSVIDSLLLLLISRRMHVYNLWGF